MFLAVTVPLLAILAGGWALALATDRNPLPFPDRHYHGFEAESIHDAEPGLPITFVRTNALTGGTIVFRKHVLRMGWRPDAWTPRADPPR